MTARVAQRIAWLAAGLGLSACPEPDRCEAPPPGYVCRVAGTGEMGFNRDGLPGVETDLYLVSAARRGPDGALYLVDYNNQRVRRMGEDGRVETLAGNGWHALADTTLPAVGSPLENPVALDFLADGRLVFVSHHDPRVLALEAGGSLEAIAGTTEPGVRGDEGDFGPSRAAQFMQLEDIAVAADGAIYLSDSMANRVRVIRGDVVTTLAGNGEAGYAGDGGAALDASLNWPTAIALAPDGSVLVADQRNHAVRRIAPDGTIDTIAGTGAGGFSGDGGPATEASLYLPEGLALAEDGSLYVADRGNFRVRRIAPEGVIDTIAGTGAEGFAGDGGPALEARFGYIARLSLDDGALLVADQSNNCVRRITLD